MEIERDPYKQAELLEQAKHMTTHDKSNPTWRHRRVGERIESKVFPANAIPEGWYETVAEIPVKPIGIVAETDKIMPKRGPGRPKGSGRKVSDVDNG